MILKNLTTNNSGLLAELAKSHFNRCKSLERDCKAEGITNLDTLEVTPRGIVMAKHGPVTSVLDWAPILYNQEFMEQPASNDYDHFIRTRFTFFNRASRVGLMRQYHVLSELRRALRPEMFNQIEFFAEEEDGTPVRANFYDLTKLPILDHAKWLAGVSVMGEEMNFAAGFTLSSLVNVLVQEKIAMETQMKVTRQPVNMFKHPFYLFVAPNQDRVMLAVSDRVPPVQLDRHILYSDWLDVVFGNKNPELNHWIKMIRQQWDAHAQAFNAAYLRGLLAGVNVYGEHYLPYFKDPMTGEPYAFNSPFKADEKCPVDIEFY